jgi:rSAM/selenodomain-associated transferase 1
VIDEFGIFAKYWQPGAVKTRLARAIGAQLAADLYLDFVRMLMQRFAATADHRVLAITPAERLDAFRQLAGTDWRVVPQSEGDLGDRLRDYFAAARSRGAERTVLIGSDSPSIPGEFVAEAFQRLADHDVVLGPSHDGGYYLVGACGEYPAMFEDIDWSTTAVWEQTIGHLDRLHVPYYVLPSWYDVDVQEDLALLDRDLRNPVWPAATVEPLRALLAEAHRRVASTRR